MADLALAQRAALQPDGGERSFTTARQPDILRRLGYEPPDVKYQRLLWDASSQPRTKTMPEDRVCGAGWYVSEWESSKDCKPLFVAHSLLAAVWVIRETLPAGTLDTASWDAIARAARRLTCDYGDGDDDDDELPPSAQRPTQLLDPSGSPPPPKRARRSRSTAGRSAQSGEDEDGAGPLERVLTVTNRNRQAERRREAQLAKRTLDKKTRVGLVQPPTSAQRSERAAYDAISPADEEEVAWIIKQPYSDTTDFYEAASTPYLTATAMLEKARVVGGPSARAFAAAFLSNWRLTGTPFRHQPALDASTPSLSVGLFASYGESAQLSRPVDVALRTAWDRVHVVKGICAYVGIQYRWAMACLGRAYADKLASIENDDAADGLRSGRSRGGKGKARTQAIDDLVPILGPTANDQPRAGIRKTLQRATRWHAAVVAMGWGFLTLIPPDQVSNHWVEQTLRAREWPLWLSLVMRVNPDVYTASRALDSWLGDDALAGGPIGDKQRLRIETVDSRAVVEEIPDTDDEQGTASDGSSSRTPSPSPDHGIRVATLPELFQPQTQRDAAPQP